MTRLLLSIVATLFAVGAVVAQPQAVNDPQPASSFNPAHVMKMVQLPDVQPLRHVAAADASDIITEQPAGKLYDGLIASYGAFTHNWLYGTMDATTDAGITKIVEGDDGFVYLYNLPTTFNSGTWVKAERTEGDTILVRRQHIDQRTSYDGATTYDYYLTRLVWEWTNQETGEGRFVAATGDQDMKLLYRDGVLKSIEDNADPYVDGHYAIGVLYTTDGVDFKWEGYANWNLLFEPMTYEKVQLPEGAKLEYITVTYDPESPKAEQIPCAFVGNDVYLTVVTEGTYIKGTIEGDKLIFKSEQFVGDYYGQYYLFFSGERMTKIVDEASGQEYEAADLLDELVFEYNAEDRSFKTTDALAINAGRKTARLNLTTLREPYFYFFKEVPATPADPVITQYNATYDQWGYNALQFTLSNTDADGNFMVPEKLTWRAWIDDEPFIFTPDDYSGLTEEMAEVPYGFIDSNYDIYTSFFTIYFEPAKNVGIQTIYRGGDEERHSNVVYYDLATAQIVSLPEDVVVGINTRQADAKVASITYHDAMGRQVTGNTKGFVIKTVHYTDGTSRSFKSVNK